ncbi:MAG: caspase family protein [Crocinitomicaceae bacterium]|nr:caspase family protein [Crocinitomicaceae bacterium]
MIQRVLVFSIIVLSSLSWAQDEHPLETVLQNGHAKYLTAYDFSDDGRFVVTGGFDQKVILWSTEKGKIIRTFNAHTSHIRSVQFNSTATQLMSAAADNQVYIYEVITGKILYQYTIEKDRLWEAHFTDDDSGVLISDNRGVVKYCEIGTDFSESFDKDYGAPIQSSIYNPRSKNILAYRDYKGFYSLNVKTKDTTGYFEFEKPRLLNYSREYKYIGVSSEKLVTNVYETNKGALLYTLINNDELCDGCNQYHAFSNNEKYIFTISSKAEGVLWDLSSGKKVKTFNTLKKRMNQVSFSPDDSKILIGYSDHVYIFDAKSGKEKVHLESGYIDYYTFRFSPDSKYFIMPGENGSVELRDASSGKVKERLFGYLNHARADGMRFSYDSWGDGGILRNITRKRSAEFSPSGNYIALSHVDSSALVIETSTGKTKYSFGNHSQLVTSVDFSEDEKYFLTTSADRTINVYDFATGELLQNLPWHREVVFDAKFTSDGSYIVSASWDGTLYIWDWRKRFYRYIDFGNVSPYEIALSKNDLYIAIANLGEKLQAYEFDSGELGKTFIGHTAITGSLAFTEENEMVSASWDGTVKLWDFNSGTLEAKLKGFKGGVFAVEVLNDGLIAAAGADKSIRIWDPNKNEIKFELVGHNSAVTDLSFDKHRNRLLSCSEDGVIKLWDLDQKSEIFTRLQISENEWLATNQFGYFDGSSKALGNVNYVSGNEVLPINSFFKKYYSPGLIERINDGEKFNDQGSYFNGKMKTVPDVSFELANKRSGINLSEEDTIPNWVENSIDLALKINSKGINVDDIHVYNNDKIIFSEALESDISFRGISSDNKSINVPLVEGVNIIKAVVVNENGVESIPTQLVVTKSGEAQKSDLYILTLGINDYKNPSYNLNHSVNDAEAFGDILNERSSGLFNEIYIESLENGQVTKEGVETKLKELIEKITINDVFVFFYAGHGVLGESIASGEQDFFMVLHDLTNFYGGKEVLNEKGFSAKELFDYSIDIQAQKQLYVIDACHSGGALNTIAQRGNEREKIIAQLARTSGTYFLTASQSQEYANEASGLEHGLFTYAILEALSGDKGDFGNEVSVAEIKSYVEQRVPELTEEYHGTPQYPTGYAFGQDFPLVLSK